MLMKPVLAQRPPKPLQGVFNVKEKGNSDGWAESLTSEVFLCPAIRAGLLQLSFPLIITLPNAEPARIREAIPKELENAVLP